MCFSMGTFLLSPGQSHNLLFKQNKWSNWNLILKLFSSLRMILVALSQMLQFFNILFEFWTPGFVPVVIPVSV